MSWLEDYKDALSRNDIDEMLDIERMFHLDSYPPGIVMTALKADEDGENMYDVIDQMMGG